MPPRFLPALFLLSLSTAAHAAGRAAECAEQAERGQVLRDELRLVDARALLVACAQRECPGVVRASCTEWLTDVDRRIPSIVVNSKDGDGHDVTGGRLLLDGAIVAESNEARAIRVDPGPHALRYEATGFDPASEQLVLREGEGVRVVTLHLVRPAPAARDPAPPPTTSPAPLLSPPPLASEKKPAGRAISPAVYALGGVSLAALGAFAYLGLTGASEYRDLDRQCAPHCADAQISAVRTRFLVADIALVVSLLSAGGAAAFYIWGGSR